LGQKTLESLTRRIVELDELIEKDVVDTHVFVKSMWNPNMDLYKLK